MADDKLTPPDSKTLDNFLRAQGAAMRAKDRPPATRKEWQERRVKLRQSMFEAMGESAESTSDRGLEPRILGTLKLDGYTIEKLIFQSRPYVWVTASAYVPMGVKGKVPAVLVVHGHWAGARRDPVVQARCLGLVKLGFFVLAVDAFGSGERYTAPAKGTYHGALYGATLWPTGHTLLGMQVYDNRRAVDYLQSRPEVDGSKIGITGASGGGNQSMYAGAVDERIGCVVPVCSVGTYQAYLRAACCVCELLPGALRFTEEGDVLGLVAPRALMVINATQDAFQFSVGEAKKSLARAESIFKLYGASEKVCHATFESPHAYNQAMREAMYGWMTRWLKGEGKGDPIPEPAHKVETWEDLACFPDPKTDRPKGFLLIPEFAARAGRALVKKHDVKPKHVEEWEARAMLMKATLRKEILGDLPRSLGKDPKWDRSEENKVRVSTGTVEIEAGLSIRYRAESKAVGEGPLPVALLLHLDGIEEARRQPLQAALLEKNWAVLMPELRGTGQSKPAGDTVGSAPDHNSTEHGLWIGRPLLGQWLVDLRALVGESKEGITIVGIGKATLLAICAGAVLGDRIRSIVALDMPTSYLTDQPYAAGTRMGVLAPGILRVGDVPHLAALACPRKLQIIGGVKPTGGKVEGKELTEAFTFTKSIYALHKAEKFLTITDTAKPEDIVKAL
jgi:dienelactone hydrolase/pimeloyl-ACP methyl ester carboxylesterase